MMKPSRQITQFQFREFNPTETPLAAKEKHLSSGK
jgi:hypothetical protein